MLSRRQLLKTGIAGVCMLGVARLAYGPFGENVSAYSSALSDQFQWLTPQRANIVSRFAPVMLQGAIPTNNPVRQQTLDEVVYGFDLAVSGLTPAIQKEVDQLFMLLELAPSRRLLFQVWDGWDHATDQQLADFLDAMKNHPIGLLQTAYAALHKLTMAAWYGNPKSWERIGYPGPPYHLFGGVG